jgi:putative membrane protein
MPTDFLPDLIAAAVYSVLGIVLFVASFAVLDRLTPGSLWTEIIEEHNTALAVMMGALSIAIGIVIAAAIL